MDAYEGFREFVLARGPALSRAAYLLTGDRSAAEELTHAALVKAAVRWRRVVAAGNPEAYVRRILVNEHISWWRRFGRRELAFGYPQEKIQSDTMPSMNDNQSSREDAGARKSQASRTWSAPVKLAVVLGAVAVCALCAFVVPPIRDIVVGVYLFITSLFA